MPNLEEYTIGWICAINTEFVAARAFLDESHGKPEGVAQNDDNIYALGRMGKHNVVIAVLPKGEYGTTPAATVARNMVHSFPNVRIGLMVGIAGGAPSKKHDIRLGDIVVSGRDGGKGGVFQYDYGKTMQNGSFVETGTLNQPPQVLLAAVNGLEADYVMEGHQLDTKVGEALERWPRLRRSHSRPPTTSDRLYQPDVTHPPDSTSDCLQACSDDPTQLVLRQERGEYDDNPAIHFGLIASGNKVVKDALMRDKLAAEKGVLCFEMEAAGLMNHFPCLVVRGICDYSDTHKNKSWQGFAAMVAAAYAKDVLGQISSSKVEMETKLCEALRSIETNLTQHLHEATARTTEIILNKHAKAIKRWLAPPDSSTNANHARELRHKGTGKWLLESDAFREWEYGSRRHLWLYGMPGCGKTVLLMTAYDYFTQEPSRIALRFFFDFSDERKQKLENLLRGLLFQLHTLQARPTSELDKLFNRYNDGQDQPDNIALSECLQKMLKHSRTVYIFVDALDECSERVKLIEWMKGFVTVSELSHVHLVMTARPEAEFNQQIPFLIQQSNCISLQTDFMNSDIQSYVQSSLKERPGFKKWASTPSTIRRISSEVGGRAGGMFRWAACQLDSLETCIDQEEIEEALISLPKSLNETYERILQRLTKHRRDRSIRLLQFLVFSPKPFTLQEAVEIIAVRPQGFHSEDRMPDPENILQFCPSLISLVPATFDASGQVHLAHFSVKEYLLSIQETFQPACASISILNTCFTYYRSVKEPASYTYRSDEFRTACRFPLLEFILREWMYFVRLAEEPAEIVEKAADILQDAPDFALWRDWVFPGTQHTAPPVPPVSGDKYGVYHACRENLPQTARALMQRNLDEGNHNIWLAALQGASLSNLPDIVKEILNMIQKTDDPDKTYGGALQIASRRGYYEIVTTLLSHGAPVHHGVQRGNGPAIICAAEEEYNALADALRWCHLPIARQLLSHRARIIARSGDSVFHSKALTVPLLIASDNGYIKFTQLLLQHGADVNAQGEIGYYRSSFGTTALQNASGAGFLDLVRLLLQHGADVNAQHPGGNALTAAIRGNNVAIVRLLLRHGANINARSASEETHGHTYDPCHPLSTAIIVNRPEMVQLLLNHGSHVNGPAGNGEPLLLAMRKKMDGMMQILLERGANPNQLVNCEYPILTVAVQESHCDAAKILVRAGADLNPTSYVFRNGFSRIVCLAFERKQFDLALFLLQKGVDLDISREHGYLKGRISLEFLDWVAQFDVPDVPELTEEISRLRCVLNRHTR